MRIVLLFVFLLCQSLFSSQINVYFTDPTNANPTINKFSTNSKPVDFALRDFILSADKGTTMYVCVYEIGNSTITAAIDEVTNRGVKVYGIFDVGVNTSVFKSSFENKKYGSSSQYMHNKFVVLKSSKVWTGSINFSTSAFIKQDNFALEIFSKELAEIYEQAFDYIWKYGDVIISSEVAKFNGKEVSEENFSIKVYFNPYTRLPDLYNILIQEWYNNEQPQVESLYFCVAWFTQQDIIETLKLLKSKNVMISGIIDGDNINFSSYYSLRNSSVAVYFDSRRSTFGEGLMHHKFCVSDPYKLTAKTICGSANWSDSALKGGSGNNYENVLIIKSQAITESFYKEYLRLYFSAVGLGFTQTDVLSKIKLYPNPVRTTFRLNFVPSEYVKEINLKILSIYGRTLYEQNVNFLKDVENSVLINLPSEIDDGIYYLVVETKLFYGEKKFYQKFIVER